MKTHRRKQVAIIGSSDADEQMLEMAEQAGRLIAELGAAIVTGGRDGIMEAASRGCADAGGTVIAVTPHTQMDDVNAYAHYHIPTGMGWVRNAITGIAGDVVLVIGGAAGTLSEIAYAWMHDRPVIAMSSSGGWARRLAGESLDHRRKDVIIDCRSMDDLAAALRKLLGT